MNVQDVIGELLYIGFVAEKGRCYGQVWSIGYRSTIRKHISELVKLNNLFENRNEIKLILNNFIFTCKNNNEIGKFYKISDDVDEITWEDIDNKFIIINQLMTYILEELNNEIKKVIINKKRVYLFLCILHNLPRVYLGEGKETLCNLHQKNISEKDALLFAFQNMNEQERIKYKKWFSDINNMVVNEEK